MLNSNGVIRARDFAHTGPGAASKRLTDKASIIAQNFGGKPTRVASCGSCWGRKSTNRSCSPTPAFASGADPKLHKRGRKMEMYR